MIAGHIMVYGIKIGGNTIVMTDVQEAKYESVFTQYRSGYNQFAGDVV